ncbi:MAG: hypothetical protein MJZ32_08900 [Bacteroidaceae bacterium]|nr:hypothetical protein [Bacteroidaceae bacterium]
MKIPKTIVKHITTKSENKNDEGEITMPHMSFEDFEKVMKKMNSPKN